jgi:hypothetical protein
MPLKRTGLDKKMARQSVGQITQGIYQPECCIWFPTAIDQSRLIVINWEHDFYQAPLATIEGDRT